MFFDRAYAFPSLVALALAIGFLGAASRRPLLARKLFLAFFAYAALTNLVATSLVPASFLGNERFALLDVQLRAIAFVGTITIVQASIALALLFGRLPARIALLAGAVVLVLGMPFPSSLIFAAGAVALATLPRARAALDAPLFTSRRLAA